MGNRGRTFFKRLLCLSRVKLLYSRVIATRFTFAYFWLTLISSLALSALQGVILADNTQAVNILGEIVANANLPPHLAMVMDDHLQICDSVPGQPNANCSVIMDLEDPSDFPAEQIPFEYGRYRRDEDEGDEADRRVTGNNFDIFRPQATTQGEIELNCVYSFSWLEDHLHDSQREDIAILFYQLWLLTMGIVTILNESIPHLWTSLLGHILGGAWAASRIQSTRTLISTYRNIVVPDLCDGFDPLGVWWEARLWHTVPIVIVNGIAILALAFLSWKILKLYSTASFTRVGASSKVHGMYRLVLMFSVGLQLTFFFSLASTALWIDKVAYGNLRFFANHSKLYLAAFIIVLLLELPFLVLGWKYVSKESRVLFVIFFACCVVLIALSSVMFGSVLYRCMFTSWSFFATTTVTSFVFLVLTTGLGVICRLNFGKGLAQYLNASEALEGVDFTPVYFPRRSDEYNDTRSVSDIMDEKKPIGYLAPRPFSGKSFLKVKGSSKPRDISVYSDQGANPVFLSVSPPLISDLDSPTRHARKLTRAAIRAERRSKYNDWRRSYFASSGEFSEVSPSAIGSRPTTANTTSTPPVTFGSRPKHSVPANRPSEDSNQAISPATTLSIPSKAFLARIRDVDSLNSPSDATEESHSGQLNVPARASDAGTTISLPSKAFLARLGDGPSLDEAPSKGSQPSLLPPGLKARQQLKINTILGSDVPSNNYPAKPQPF